LGSSGHLPSSPLPSSPPLHPKPTAKSERKKKKRARAYLSHRRACLPASPLLSEAMADVQEPLPWGRSTATEAVLGRLVEDRLLPLNPNSGAPAWISPRPEETEPNSP